MTSSTTTTTNGVTMTDDEPTTEDVEEQPAEPDIPDVEPPTYPDTTVGMLMRDRDGARASARAARDQADRYEALEADANARADSFQAAIEALGGDPEGSTT